MSDPPQPNNLTSRLTADLLTRHHLAVSPTWLSNFLHNTRQPLPPLAALTSTAHFRLLTSDFTASLSPTSSRGLPADIGDANVKERRIAGGGSVPVQVLDVEDIGSSRWSQVEAVERVERGEEVRGREVIRTLPVVRGEGGEDGPSTATNAAVATASASAATKKSSGPHKMLLQDARGTRVTAFEAQRIPRLGIGDEGMAIGMKLLLKEGTMVRRGVLILAPENVVVLGGKVESWDKGWREGRKERLAREAEGENQREEGQAV